MNTDKAMQVVLPLADPRSLVAAFPVARVVANTAHAGLHIVTTGAHLPAVQDFVERMSLPQEERDAIAIEAASGDVIDAAMQTLDAARQSVVVLAARIGDETDRNADTDAAFGRQVLETVTCPVLVVPPDKDMSAWRWRKELLPQDGTPGCAGALAQIINRSASLGIENLVLRIAGANVGQPTEPGSLATPRYVDHPQYEWEQWGQEFLDRICGMGARVDEGKLTLLMASGEPGAETIRVAREKEVDMIVLPWHCAIGSGRAHLIKAVLRGAHCPVLLLPEDGGGRCAADG
ncbi:universal stress protein [Noviherbaspirillum sp.]|uniref:universal stress protein n=1 Tax=Noviherbaspirillum sp. TaxID=1926288 RepID=UPI0025D4D53C|nr:universal stress protein [Noviherbaspirillum sp.]